MSRLLRTRAACGVALAAVLFAGACGPKTAKTAKELIAGKLNLLPDEQVAAVRALLANAAVAPEEILVFERRAGCTNCLHILHDVELGERHVVHLELPGAGIKQIGSLAALPWLLTAKLARNKITKASGFCGKRLTHIDLSNNQIGEVELGKGCHELETLELSGNKLTAFPDVSGARKLLSLKLNNNKIGSLKPPAKQTLRALEMDETGLATLDGLKSLPELRWLSARKNAITSLALLAQQGPQLKSLNVDHNKLRGLDSLLGEKAAAIIAARAAAKAPDVPPKDKNARKGRGKGKRSKRRGKRAAPAPPTLPPPPPVKALALHRLTASHNAISSIRGLPLAAPWLAELDLSHNRLVALPGLHQLKKLTEVLVDHNQLETLDSLHHCFKHTRPRKLPPGARALLGDLLGKRAPGCRGKLRVVIADHNKLNNAAEIFAAGKRPELSVYDFRHNQLVGVAAAMLHESTPRGGKRYVLGAYLKSD